MAFSTARAAERMMNMFKLQYQRDVKVQVIDGGSCAQDAAEPPAQRRLFCLRALYIGAEAIGPKEVALGRSGERVARNAPGALT